MIFNGIYDFLIYYVLLKYLFISCILRYMKKKWVWCMILKNIKDNNVF